MTTDYDQIELKTCSLCGEAKPISEYYLRTDKNAPPGSRRNRCRTCHANGCVAAMTPETRQAWRQKSRTAIMARRPPQPPPRPRKIAKRKNGEFQAMVIQAVRDGYNTSPAIAARVDELRQTVTSTLTTLYSQGRLARCGEIRSSGSGRHRTYVYRIDEAKFTPNDSQYQYEPSPAEIAAEAAAIRAEWSEMRWAQQHGQPIHVEYRPVVVPLAKGAAREGVLDFIDDSSRIVQGRNTRRRA